jgi:hypothetical protein
MGSLIEAIINALAEWLLGKGIERGGALFQRRGVRIACIVLVLAIAAWIAVASAFLWQWEGAPGISGLLAYVQAGGPVWLLVLPAAAALTVIIALLPVTGRFTPVVLLTTVIFGMSLASLAVLQGGGSGGINGAAVASWIPSLPLPLLALVLAFGDVPSLDSPLAALALVYLMRRRHLLALREWGRRLGWKVSGPAGPNAALTVTGAYDPQHPVTITSSEDLRLTSSAYDAYKFVVRMSSPADIISLRITSIPLSKREQQRLRGIVSGRCRTKGKSTLYYYLLPDPGYPLSEEFLSRFAALVEAGRPFLHGRDLVQAVPIGIRYTHAAYYGLSPRQVRALDPMLRWMRDLCTLLEPVSPPAKADAPQPPSQSPWQASY